ncbi:HPP family protein [Sandarakinorhabdus sp.]|uniref:HPP family protein n=1 Tax=Sandarakinorhabdus sp. TaxID=1916663 RepID=UPI003F725663
MSARSSSLSMPESGRNWAKFPRLAGANFADRLGAGVAAVAGIALAAVASTVVPLAVDTAPMLVAPIGASAVLVFAVPASPLAQPWSVLGGNIVSAVVGMMAAALVPVPALAAGVAVGGAIIVMSVLRCLHPPGGAMALTVVLGTPLLDAAGLWFPLLPVGLNSLALVLAAWAWHRISGHSYPHRPAPAVAPLFHREDMDKALADMGEAFDVAPDDLDALLQRAEAHARARKR